MISRIRGGGARSLLLGVVAILVVLVADGVYAGLRFRSTFTSAACGLKHAAAALEELDIAAAERGLASALEQIDAAAGLLRHPSLRLAGALPGVSRDLDVLESLTVAARGAARSGLIGAEAATALGASKDSSLGRLYRDGRVSFDAIEGAADAVTRATERLQAARSALAHAPRASLARIRRSHGSATELVADALGSLRDTSAVLDDLPALFGREGTRRYFLAFQAPSEARGGGGLIGVYGVLTARDGRLRLERVAPIRVLVRKLDGKVAAPAWYESLYGGVDGLGGWREANSSPTFPTVAKVLLRMYERSTGRSLDGAIAMDPLVVAELLRGVGPIEARGFPEAVTAANAPRILMRDIYLRFVGDEESQNRFLRDLVERLWERLGDGSTDPDVLKDALVRSVARQRLKFFSAARDERDVAGLLGMSGDPRASGPNLQMFFHNNFAANKIDWFLRRSQTTTIAIDRSGRGRVVASIELDNTAPRGHRSLLKKSDVNELPAGLNLMSLHLVMPERAEVNEMYLGSTPTDGFSGLEAGVYPEVWAPVQVPVQDRAGVSVSYDIPELVTFRNGRATFDMTFLPQALVRPDRFALTVIAPEGYRVGGMGRSASLADRFEVGGTLDRLRRVRARLLAPGVEPRSGGNLLAETCGPQKDS